MESNHDNEDTALVDAVDVIADDDSDDANGANKNDGAAAIAVAALAAKEDTNEDNNNYYDDDDDANTVARLAGGLPHALPIDPPFPPPPLEEEHDNDDVVVDDFHYDDDDGDRIVVLNKLMSIAQQQPKFPLRQRIKIIELAHNFFAATGDGDGDDNDDDDDDDDGDDDDDDDDDDDGGVVLAPAVAAAAAAGDDAADANNDIAVQAVLSLVVAGVEEELANEDANNNNNNENAESAREFIVALGADIKEMVTDQRTEEHGYAGLDSSRDTKEEVETALRFYPEVLSERGGMSLNMFPIQCITMMWDQNNKRVVMNRKAVGFAHLFATLAIEVNSFAEEERGGLLLRVFVQENVPDFITLYLLVTLTLSCALAYGGGKNHELADTACLAVLVQLQGSGLLKKDDIERYRLMHGLCQQKGYFAEKRFHFLIECDPSSLLQIEDVHGNLPLHYALSTQTIRQFEVMIDAYFRYFTKEKVICLLFQKNNYGDTPFKVACHNFHKRAGDTMVHDAVEQALCISRSASLNIGKGLVMAATYNSITHDGLYYFIRKQPDVMLCLLHHTSSSSSSS